jgi:HEAT repeat protein
VNEIQERAARMLGRGHSQTAAAKEAGVTDRTIRSWLQTVPGFREAAQHELELAPEPDALTTLRALLKSSREDIRLRAAIALMRQPDDGPTDDAPQLPPGAVLTFPDED